MSSDTSAPGHSSTDRQIDGAPARPVDDRAGWFHCCIPMENGLFSLETIVGGKSFGSAFTQNTAKSPSCTIVALYRWPKINTLLPLRKSSIMQVQCNWIHPYRSHSIGYVYRLLLYVNTQTKALIIYQAWVDITRPHMHCLDPGSSCASIFCK